MTHFLVKYILHLCIFRHLKLEIALAIPASNDEKYNSYTSISGFWHAPRHGSQRVKPFSAETDFRRQNISAMKWLNWLYKVRSLLNERSRSAGQVMDRSCGRVSGQVRSADKSTLITGTMIR